MLKFNVFFCTKEEAECRAREAAERRAREEAERKEVERARANERTPLFLVVVIEYTHALVCINTQSHRCTHACTHVKDNTRARIQKACVLKRV